MAVVHQTHSFTPQNVAQRLKPQLKRGHRADPWKASDMTSLGTSLAQAVCSWHSPGEMAEKLGTKNTGVPFPKLRSTGGHYSQVNHDVS